ncbi:MAG TPA: hypothetical protein VF384_00590 [Planctomycetota bacterium]
MAPARRTLAAVAGAIAVLALALVLGPWRPGADDVAVAGASHVVPPPPPVAVSDGGASARVDLAGARTAVTTGEFVADEQYPFDAMPPGYAGIQVVTAGQRRPVPGAKVWFVGAQMLPDVRGSRTAPWVDGTLRWLMANGTTTTTDAAGRARVPVASDVLQVAAAKDSAFGVAEIDILGPAPAGGWQVAINPGHWLRIEVVDAGGAGVPDVPLGFDEYVGLDLVSGRTVLGHTDAAGVLVVAGEEDVIAAAARGSIEVVGLGTAAASSEYRADAGTLRLVLPPCGVVEVAYVDCDGSAIPGHRLVWWCTKGSAGTSPRVSSLTDADGCLRLLHVPLGLSWHGTLDMRLATFAGPTRSGEVVRESVTPGEDAVVLRGRVIAAGGVPVANTPLLAELAPVPAGDADSAALWPVPRLADEGRRVHVPPSAPPSLPVQGHERLATVTMSDGRFAFVADRRAGVERRGVVWLLPAPRSADCRHAEFRVPAATAGDVIDLGDLVLGDEGLVLSGRIVDEGGQPATNVHVAAAMFDGSPGALREVAFASADGLLRVYRNRSEPESPVRIEVRAFGGACATYVGREGQHDVRIVLRRQPRLRVELLVDADVLPLAEQAASKVRLRGAVVQGATAKPHDGRWTFEHTLEEGDYEFGVVLRLGEERIVDVPVACRDGHVHVHRADLRGRLFVHMVEVRDGDGNPLSARCASCEVAQDGTVFHREVCDSENGVVRVLASRATSQLWLTAEGHEPLHVAASREPTRVVMRRLPQLRLSLVSMFDGTLPALQWLDGREWREAGLARITPPSFEPLRLRVVVDCAGEPFALPLAPLPITPGMQQDVDVALSPDQIETLRTARRR